MFQKSSYVPASRDEYPRPDTDTVETVVGPSVHVEGDFSSEGNILVKGSVAGNVKTSKLLTVQEGARISANVRAGDTSIAGEINGNVTAENKVELFATARVTGDIVCKVLAVEAGALVHGKIMMQGMEPSEKGNIVRKKTSSRLRARDEEGDGSEDLSVQ